MSFNVTLEQANIALSKVKPIQNREDIPFDAGMKLNTLAVATVAGIATAKADESNEGKAESEITVTVEGTKIKYSVLRALYNSGKSTIRPELFYGLEPFIEFDVEL